MARENKGAPVCGGLNQKVFRLFLVHLDNEREAARATLNSPFQGEGEASRKKSRKKKVKGNRLECE